jgi:hypothetical protein
LLTFSWRSAIAVHFRNPVSWLGSELVAMSDDRLPVAFVHWFREPPVPATIDVFVKPVVVLRDLWSLFVRFG